MVQVLATSTIYIQGQSQPYASNPAATVTVSSLPIPSVTQPSYSGTVNLLCGDTALTNGFACSLTTPDTFINGIDNGSANITSPASLTVPSNTPVGLYTVTATGADNSAVTDTHSTSFGLSVQCILSLQQLAPVFVPASSSSDGNNQYQVSVSVSQGGDACPFGNAGVTGVTAQPGPVSVDGQVVTTLLTGTSGTASTTTPGTVTFETEDPGSAPASGTVTVPFFDATQTQDQNTTTIPVTLEVPVPLTATTISTGVEQGTISLTPTQSGTLTIPNIPNSAAPTVCGVVPSNANITCTASGNVVTVTVVGGGAAKQNVRAGLAMSFALGFPAVVFLATGLSAFGPRSKKRGLRRIASALGILLVLLLLTVLPSCGGGFKLPPTTTFTGTVLTVVGYTSGANPDQAVEIFTINLTVTQ